MPNDRFPSFSHLTLTQLGEVFGVSPQEIGKRLTAAGLRRSSVPTDKALVGGIAKLHSPDGGGNPFYVWAKEKSVAILKVTGLSVADEPRVEDRRLSTPELKGPFSIQRSGDDGDGYEIVGGDGTVGVWVRGEQNAHHITDVLNLFG